MSVERLKQKNLEKAINGYLEALKTFDKDEHTFLSSKTKNSLGNAYVNRIFFGEYVFSEFFQIRGRF